MKQLAILLVIATALLIAVNVYAGQKIEDVSALMEQRIAYSASGEMEYIGIAAPGTAEAAPYWRIKKLSYTDGNLTSIKFANGSTRFEFAWSQRTTYFD